MAHSTIQWKHVSSSGPPVAFSASCVSNGCLYVHGGVQEARSTKPLNGFYKFSFETLTWETVDAPNSPFLSHHTSVSVDTRFILFIGGWNGKERSSTVFAFDTDTCLWEFVANSGFPVGAGLSSHTANLLSPNEILVVGREGSLRTQRRSGNAFHLIGSMAKMHYTYSEHPLSVASRSGHTTNIVGKTLVILGGRNDKLLEVHKLSMSSPHITETVNLSTIHELMHETLEMAKQPAGRKNHSAVTMSNCILMYGGETFDGRSKEPVSDLYVLQLGKHLSWKHLTTNIGRAAHVCCIHDNSIIIHGGIGEGNHVTNGTYILS